MDHNNDKTMPNENNSQTDQINTKVSHPHSNQNYKRKNQQYNKFDIPPPPNDTSIWVNHNISSKIFKTTLTEETKTKFNFKRNGRRLDDESKTKTNTNIKLTIPINTYL